MPLISKAFKIELISHAHDFCCHFQQRKTYFDDMNTYTYLLNVSNQMIPNYHLELHTLCFVRNIYKE